MTSSHNHSLISRTLSRDHSQDRIPLRPPTRFNRTMGPRILRSLQHPNETLTLTRINLDPCPPAGSVGPILLPGPTMLIIIRGVPRGTGPRRTKRSTPALKPAKRMLLAIVTAAVFLLMTCWKLRITLRSPETRPRAPTLPLVPLQRAPTPLLLELARYLPDGRNGIPQRGGPTTLITILEPPLGWIPDARQ